RRRVSSRRTARSVNTAATFGRSGPCRFRPSSRRPSGWTDPGIRPAPAAPCIYRPDARRSQVARAGRGAMIRPAVRAARAPQTRGRVMPYRHLSLALSLPALMFASAAFAQGQQDFSAVEIKTHQVSGNVYYLEGAGGNVGLLVGDD